MKNRKTQGHSPAIRGRPSAQTSIEELLHDPRYFLFDTLPSYGKTKFLITRESDLAGATFTDIRFERQAGGSLMFDTRKLIDLYKQDAGVRPETHYIFHHAFVCSTLLARCLNQSKAYISLKEPWILRRLADIKRDSRIRMSEKQWTDLFTTYTSLLAKRYETGKSLVIKATNIASNLIQDLARYQPARKIIYLYSDIPKFLVSNLKKPASTQQKMPGLLAGFVLDSDITNQAIEFNTTRPLTLLQTCAMIWVCNIYALMRTVQRHDCIGLRTLDMQHFLSDPGSSLAGITAHFGHVADAEDLAQMTHPDVMGRNAKESQQNYSVLQKESEHAQVYELYRQDVDATVDWIRPVVARLRLGEFLKSRAL